MRQFAFMILVVLYATHTTAELTFYDKHVKATMDPGQCKDAMVPINNFRKNCKYLHTFILKADLKDSDLCKKEGKNPQKFNVVTCTVKDSKAYPNCEYAGKNDNRNVDVFCSAKKQPDYIEN